MKTYLLSDLPNAINTKCCTYTGLKANLDKGYIPLSNGNCSKTNGWRRFEAWDVIRIAAIYKMMQFGVPVKDAVALASDHFDLIPKEAVTHPLTKAVTIELQLEALSNVRFVIFQNDGEWVAFDVSKTPVTNEDHGGCYLSMDIGLLAASTIERLNKQA